MFVSHLSPYMDDFDIFACVMNVMSDRYEDILIFFCGGTVKRGEKGHGVNRDKNADTL